jgi:uncharacterized protein (TIGR00290 family)
MRMPEVTPVIVSWSGGKDSCLALQRVLARGDLRVEALLTTVTADFDRISMHGVRRELLEEQAKALGLPLRQVLISRSATNEEYETEMAKALTEYRARGVNTVVFGDLFLEDIRAYRERLLARQGMRGLYPLWGLDTAVLIRDFIAQGYKAAMVCIDPAKLPPGFAGRVIDPSLLADLPANVDPCGENGEFHTFVFDGPTFKAPIRFQFGEKVCRDSFWFCDLIPDRVEDMAC